MLGAALKYAELGYRVIPLFGIVEGKCECGKADCVSPGKHPRIQDWQHKASSEDAVVRRWWGMWEQSNIGILLNPDLVVLDIDRHGETDGYESFRKAEELHGPIPETVSATTGGGGLHFYFRGKCRTHKYKDLPGVDVKGQDSFTILPPSRHISGGAYEWADNASIFELKIADAPKWLLRPDKAQSAAQRNGEALTVWGEGERNVNLLRHAGVLRRYGHTPQRILSFLTELNAENCSPPLDTAEVAYIAKSISRYPADPYASRTVGAEPLPGGAIDVSSYPLTEGANADLFVRLFGEDYVHVRERGTGVHIDNGWFHYSGGGLWQNDPNSAYQDVRVIANMRRYDASQETDADLAKAKRSWAKSSDGANGIKNTLRLAATDKLIEAKQKDFDKNRKIICTPQGVADLETGKLREATRDDMLTLCTAVPYNPEADTAEWEKFVLEIMDGDKELAEYLQRLTGYTLTGLITARAWVMLYGEHGLNGKNTFLDTIQKAMGSYAHQSNVETWLVSRNVKKANAMAALYGKRLTVTSETDERRKLDENLIKQITGDDFCNAEFKYGHEFSYEATVKLWLATNKRPTVTTGGNAFWSRLKIIPFMRQFPVDPLFKEHIQSLAPLALTWAVRGARMFFEAGCKLQDPSSVLLALDDYKTSSDELHEWKSECCIIDPDEVELSSDLYKSYTDWCETDGQKPMTKTMFGKKLDEAGFTKDRDKARRMWKGIRVRSELDFD